MREHELWMAEFYDIITELCVGWMGGEGGLMASEKTKGPTLIQLMSIEIGTDGEDLQLPMEKLVALRELIYFPF